MTRARLFCVFLACVLLNGCDSSDPVDPGPMMRVPGPPSGDCGSVRLTSYEASVSGGWCEFPRDLPMLPAFVRAGFTAAIAEPWNDSSYDGDPGEACGECWELDTVTGTRIVMIDNLCPIEGNALCAGSQFHLDISREASDELNAGFLDEASARRVACPVEGNIHILVNDENVTYLRVQLVNQRIPVRLVEFRGAGSVSGPNEWTPAQRSGGAWEIIGGDRPTDRGGSGVQIRLTSAQGQVVESEAVVDSHPPRGSTFDLGVQFEDRMPSSGGSCEFVPPGDIFVDGFGGIDEVRWQINPWGEAESGFFGETSEGCFAGTCLGVERLAQYSGFHLYYRQAFAVSTFSRLRFRARTQGGTAMLYGGASNDGEGCSEMNFEVGPEWTEHVIDLAATCGALERLNGLTLANGSEQVYLLLDDVRFER